ncbi:hypothetical protein BE20_09515 [Sorangium cellulosum]|nr:hypothetical protein BE20_09515 [Sorangium cellulosum]
MARTGTTPSPADAGSSKNARRAARAGFHREVLPAVTIDSDRSSATNRVAGLIIETLAVAMQPGDSHMAD